MLASSRQNRILSARRPGTAPQPGQGICVSAPLGGRRHGGCIRRWARQTCRKRDPKMTPEIVGADTAWVLVSSALVMLMVPGLALFYGGMVQRKNVLSTLMHSF